MNVFQHLNQKSHPLLDNIQIYLNLKTLFTINACGQKWKQKYNLVVE